MLKKRPSYLIAVSLLLLLNVLHCSNSSAENPALKLAGLYSEGTIDPFTVNPYVLNIIAIYEISGQRHIKDVNAYIRWYFDHLNYPDRDGFTGTIYDYEINKTGQESSTGRYDSVDGYAGTFLYLLNLYYRQTGDKELIMATWEKIKDIAYLLPYLQDSDGLTKALFKGKDNTKYLMDNCESYAGLKAFNDLAEQTGHIQDPFYLETETDIKNAVINIFYSDEGKNFHWAVDDNIKHTSDWTVLYPDALAQIFPIYFGLLDDAREKRRSLWLEFNKRHGDKPDLFPLEQRFIYELIKNKMTN